MTDLTKIAGKNIDDIIRIAGETTANISHIAGVVNNPVTPTGNYFGSGSDGDVTITSNTNLTVPNKVGSYDGDMVLMNYESLVVNSGMTLSTDQPCRGLFIYVKGNCTINGAISMTARGPFANPTVSGGSDSSIVSSTGLRLPIIKSGSSDTLASADFAGSGNAIITALANQPGISGNGKIYTFVRQGAAGTQAGYFNSWIHPPDGNSGGVGQTGGGASGGGYRATPGAGSYGSCFGGGSGGGDGVRQSGGLNAVAWGGAGGNGNYTGGGAVLTRAGSGNPGGTGLNDCFNGNNGTGGLIVLIVGGNLTIGASAGITANGVGGGYGGGSGGGNILVLHAGTLSNSGTIEAAGGIPAAGQSVESSTGGAGSVQGPDQIA